MPKKSKKIIHNRSYLKILDDVVFELFSPSSQKSLINYNDLKLLNMDELRFIRTKDLKLIDSRQLNLLHIPTLAIFFQYIGALSMLLLALSVSSLFLIAGSGDASANNLNRAEVGVVATQVEPREVVDFELSMVTVDETLFTPEVIEIPSVEVTPTFATLIESQPEVLGVQDVVVEEALVSESVNSCSFTIETSLDSKTAKYSDGSRFLLSRQNASNICVDYSGVTSTANWLMDVFGGAQTLSQSSNCISSYEISNASNLSVNLVDSSGSVVAGCALSLAREEYIAAR